jgi:glycosyltransferase involved in cell wall biosynthesis
MTKDRPEYLKRTLESLGKTKNRDFQLIIYDDNSQKEEQLRLLDDCVHTVVMNYHNYNLGTKKLWLSMMDDCFNYRRADYFIHIQDDIIFHPDWLDRLLAVKDNIPNLGILTPWDRRHWGGESGDGWVMRNMKGKTCKIGGCCWLVTRAFGLKVLELYQDKTLTRNCFDSFFQGVCNNLGFNIAATSPSWVDHFGIDSIAHKGKKRTASSYRAWNPVEGMEKV